jgi:hypothetical protein
MSRCPVSIVYTYVQPRRNKYGHARTYGGGSNVYLRIHTARVCLHGEATDGSNGVVFMGSQPAGSKRRNSVVFIRRGSRLGRNAPVPQEPTCLDGTAETGSSSSTPHRLGAWRTAKHTKQSSLRPPTVETGSYSSGGAWRTRKCTKQTSRQPRMIKTGSY